MNPKNVGAYLKDNLVCKLTLLGFENNNKTKLYHVNTNKSFFYNSNSALPNIKCLKLTVAN